MKGTKPRAARTTNAGQCAPPRAARTCLFALYLDEPFSNCWFRNADPPAQTTPYATMIVLTPR